MVLCAKNDLIIDVGMHTGKDSEFYLKKGFRVVGIEANPKCVEIARKQLAPYVNSGLLKIYPLAVGDHDGHIDLYINQQKDDWGTTSKQFATRNENLGTTNKVITVECVRFERILEECGVPYYLKIDIEGADMVCVEALHKFKMRPRYISIEADLVSFEETFNGFSHLWLLGYRKFKLVNQALNHTIRCPNPSLEGEYVEVHFDGMSSGPFGEESPGTWMSIEETLSRYRSIMKEQYFFGECGRLAQTFLKKWYQRYKRFTRQGPIGWYDLHACLGDIDQVGKSV